MIINHTHRFIFVHVPKSAGTSVTDLFSQFSTYRDLEVGGTELGEVLQQAFKLRFGLTKHSTAGEIRNVVGDAVWSAYYTFGVVRDPYARALSTFHYMKRWQGNKEMDRLKFMSKMTDFPTFVMSKKFQRKEAHRLFWSQSQWLCDENGKVLVDKVCRLEQLDADLQAVCKAIPGLPQPVAAAAEEVPAGATAEAPKLNRSAASRSALHDMLRAQPEVEAAVYEAYKDDFERFEYPRFKA